MDKKVGETWHQKYASSAPALYTKYQNSKGTYIVVDGKRLYTVSIPNVGYDHRLKLSDPSTSDAKRMLERREMENASEKYMDARIKRNDIGQWVIPSYNGAGDFRTNDPLNARTVYDARSRLAAKRGVKY
jgi:hypothetical protein